MPSGLNELDGVEKILEFVAVRQFSEPLEIFRADAPCRVDLFLDLFQTLKSCNGAVVLGSVRGTHHFRQGVLVGLEFGDDTGFRQAKPPPTPLMPDKIFGAVELPGTDGTTGANRLVPKLIEFFFVFTGEEQAGSENSMGEGILAGGRLPLYRFRPVDFCAFRWFAAAFSGVTFLGIFMRVSQPRSNRSRWRAHT